MRIFFGGTFISKEELENAGISHPIKLEYYKQINEDEMNCYGSTKYGIQIVKTEYIPNNPKTEIKELKYVTNDEIEEDRILSIFKNNQVTLINSEEIISDLYSSRKLQLEKCN